MSGGTFTRCHNVSCRRMLLLGQDCPCGVRSGDPRCDCTYDGNTQHIGPHCQSQITEAWRLALTSRR